MYGAKRQRVNEAKEVAENGFNQAVASSIERRVNSMFYSCLTGYSATRDETEVSTMGVGRLLNSSSIIAE
jgi:hypothetical protein